MKKAQYLSKLKVKLIKSGLKKAEVDGALQYYGELIDEAVDNGENEEQVVARLPSPQDAADEIKGVNETPYDPLIDEKPQDVKSNGAKSSGTRADGARADSAWADGGAKANTSRPNTNTSGAGAGSSRANGATKEPQYKKTRNIAAAAALLIVFAIFILPVGAIIFSVLLSVFAAVFSVMASMLACAVVLPVYAVIVAAIGSSGMIFFVYLAAGLVCLAIGLFLIKAVKPVVQLLLKLSKGVFKIMVSFVRGY